MTCDDDEVVQAGAGPKPDAPARMAVNKIFATLRISFPAWYERHYGDEQAERLAKRIWLTGIRKLTAQQVDRGLQRMVLDADFPPHLRAFLQLCRKIDGVPEVTEAWREALTGHYSHAVVRAAAQLTGLFELRRAQYQDRGLFARFDHHYAVVLCRFEDGQPLGGAVNQALGHESQKSAFQQAYESAEQQLLVRMEAQGIPRTGQEARQALLASLGIRMCREAMENVQ